MRRSKSSPTTAKKHEHTESKKRKAPALTNTVANNPATGTTIPSPPSSCGKAAASLGERRASARIANRAPAADASTQGPATDDTTGNTQPYNDPTEAKEDASPAADASPADPTQTNNTETNRSHSPPIVLPITANLATVIPRHSLSSLASQILPFPNPTIDPLILTKHASPLNNTIPPNTSTQKLNSSYAIYDAQTPLPLLCKVEQLNTIIHSRLIYSLKHAHSALERAANTPNSTLWKQCLEVARSITDNQLRTIHLGNEYTTHMFTRAHIPYNLYNPKYKQNSPKYRDEITASILIHTHTMAKSADHDNLIPDIPWNTSPRQTEQEGTSSRAAAGTTEPRQTSAHLLHAELPHLTALCVASNTAFASLFPRTCSQEQACGKHLRHHATVPNFEYATPDQRSKTAPKTAIQIYSVAQHPGGPGQSWTSYSECTKYTKNKSHTIVRRFDATPCERAQAVAFATARLADMQHNIKIHKCSTIIQAETGCQICTQIITPPYPPPFPNYIMDGHIICPRPCQTKAFGFPECGHPICYTCLPGFIAQANSANTMTLGSKFLIHCPGRNNKSCELNGHIDIDHLTECMNEHEIRLYQHRLDMSMNTKSPPPQPQTNDQEEPPSAVPAHASKTTLESSPDNNPASPTHLSPQWRLDRATSEAPPGASALSKDTDDPADLSTMRPAVQPGQWNVTAPTYPLAYPTGYPTNHPGERYGGGPLTFYSAPPNYDERMGGNGSGPAAAMPAQATPLGAATSASNHPRGLGGDRPQTTRPTPGPQTQEVRQACDWGSAAHTGREPQLYDAYPLPHNVPTPHDSYRQPQAQDYNATNDLIYDLEVQHVLFHNSKTELQRLLDFNEQQASLIPCDQAAVIERQHLILINTVELHQMRIESLCASSQDGTIQHHYSVAQNDSIVTQIHTRANQAATTSDALYHSRDEDKNQNAWQIQKRRSTGTGSSSSAAAHRFPTTSSSTPTSSVAQQRFPTQVASSSAHSSSTARRFPVTNTQQRPEAQLTAPAPTLPMTEKPQLSAYAAPFSPPQTLGHPWLTMPATGAPPLATTATNWNQGPYDYHHPTQPAVGHAGQTTTMTPQPPKDSSWGDRDEHTVGVSTDMEWDTDLPKPRKEALKTLRFRSRASGKTKLHDSTLYSGKDGPHWEVKGRNAKEAYTVACDKITGFLVSHTDLKPYLKADDIEKITFNHTGYVWYVLFTSHEAASFVHDKLPGLTNTTSSWFVEWAKNETRSGKDADNGGEPTPRPYTPNPTCT